MGRTIVVRFDSLPGDHPLLVVDQTHLSGDNLQVTVYEVISRVVYVCVSEPMTYIVLFHDCSIKVVQRTYSIDVRSQQTVKAMDTLLNS